MDVDFKAMPGEMLADIGALDLVLLAAFVGDDHDFNAAALADDRQGVGNGASGRAAAVPANHHIVIFERRLLDVRHYDYRAPGLEQRVFADDLLDAADVRLRLPDNRKIETPRHARELIARAGEASIPHQRLGGNSGLVCGCVETLDGSFGRGFVVIALRLDDLGGDVASAGNRHHRVVDEGDAGQVRLQSSRDRDGILSDDSAFFGDAEIDDDIFDHNGVSWLNLLSIVYRSGRRPFCCGSMRRQVYFLTSPSASNCLR